MVDIITTVEGLWAAYPVLVAQIEKEAREGTENDISIRIENNKDGRIWKWTEETRDSKGVVVAKREDEYTYYPTGEIHRIVQSCFDVDNLISKTEVLHFTDGRQPEIKKII